MEEIIREKVDADHLLYVSLKYTKTCDVISNLLLRWSRLVEVSVDRLLEQAKGKKKIKVIPTEPLAKMSEAKKLFSRNKNFREVIELYGMFRKVKGLRCEKIGDYRKNVNLKVYYKGEEINVDMEKLREYSLIIDEFFEFVKKHLSL